MYLTYQITRANCQAAKRLLQVIGLMGRISSPCAASNFAPQFICIPICFQATRCSHFNAFAI